MYLLYFYLHYLFFKYFFNYATFLLTQSVSFRQMLSLDSACFLCLINSCTIRTPSCNVDSDKLKSYGHYCKALTYVWQQISHTTETTFSQIICG